MRKDALEHAVATHRLRTGGGGFHLSEAAIRGDVEAIIRAYLEPLARELRGDIDELRVRLDEVPRREHADLRITIENLGTILGKL